MNATYTNEASAIRKRSILAALPLDRASWRPIVGAPVEASRLYSVVVIGDQVVIVGGGIGDADEP